MHNTDDDCWVLYYDTVYDLTVYAWQHPGGAGIIFVDCGRDGTAAYDAYHPKSYLLEVEDDKVGIIDTPTHPPMSTDPPVSTEPPIVPTNQTLLPTTPEPTTVVTEQPGIRLEEVAEHATPEDCWVVFYEHVYDMTEYAELHPDGPGSIWPTCGTDGTKAYEVYHERDLLLAVQHYIVGPYVAESEPSSPSPDVDRVITSDELSLHNESDNCWIAYYEYVYEMSYYIHPEPSEVQSVIKTSCGSDGTKDFVKVHPKAVIKSIGKLKVGKYSMSMRMSLYIPLVVSAIGTALLVAF
jgi:cytochrome b involved in lipid metabolism